MARAYSPATRPVCSLEVRLSEREIPQIPTDGISLTLPLYCIQKVTTLSRRETVEIALGG